MKKRIIRALIISLILSLILFFLIKILYSSRDQAKPENREVSSLRQLADRTIGSEFVCQDCNVILITMTNLRYDHMSSNGYFRSTTANLDKLAKESLVFDNAFAHSSWTLPEGISIYTGLYPFEHGIMNRYDGSKLASNIPTLIDIFNANGYRTAAFTGGFDYTPEFGLTNRFFYHKECPKEETGQGGQPVMGGPNQYGEFSCTVSYALAWLKVNINSKFFIHIQGFDAHCPFSQKGGRIYDPNYQGAVDYSDCLWTFDRSEPITKDGEVYYPVYSPKTTGRASVLLGKRDIEHLIALYDEGITFADQQIGLLINEVEKIGLSDKTIIIFTSEHGDMFGKHGRFMRGGPLRGTFYDDVLHIPLIIKHPKISPKTNLKTSYSSREGVPSGTPESRSLNSSLRQQADRTISFEKSSRLEGLVQHVDLMPTLLDFLGLKSQHNLSGKSLTPLILQNKEVNSYVFAGSEFTPTQDNMYFFKKTRINAIRNKQWKLIQETIFDSEAKNPSQTIELYDIVNDKEELNNLAGKDEEILKDLQLKLNTWSKKVGER